MTCSNLIKLLSSSARPFKYKHVLAMRFAFQSIFDKWTKHVHSYYLDESISSVGVSGECFRVNIYIP